mmetsp:Transcript_18019/g.33269  ORF Transcript_18019/g.33269 Transcript_18019/m.33269 type:complete len:197 (+) Transcript_18019:29-619(+)|eukprot:CAMPEP_0184516110 /NCGR_PEP_ID=MMETSP0198_2-20121128/4854_1 /TAXON_ID=1112570 /ORGANISM="Thraustochytrium sp., Strain LLF1b" /LENGTH=196 /DNA_ID=CAMNT_0026906409 /DNA_START=77 /DNA_END=667 /DNA_ORIENTATION=+
MASVDAEGGGMGGFDRVEGALTLDEPVSVTILRDLKTIAVKLKYVLLPSATEEETISELRNWDLWGPLLLCLVLSVLLSLASSDQASTAFSSVFVIVWCGAFVVTLNAQLLGGKLSCFQSVCVLGYCIFPLVVAAVICQFWSNVIFKAVVVLLGLGWATRASMVFMSQLVPAERKLLVTYPVGLFYVVISWMIFIS